MQVSINGSHREVPIASPLSQLSELRERALGEVAVALNGNFVPHAEWARHQLSENDCIDVVAPVEGG